MEYVEYIKIKKKMTDNCKISCLDCPLYQYRDKNLPCTLFQNDYPEKAEAIVKEWAKAHPIKTNEQKFREVFGVGINASTTNHGYFIIDNLIKADSDSKYIDTIHWLEAEYKETEG